MPANQEEVICPPNVKDLIAHTLNKLNADCSNLIGRNFGISKPNYEITTVGDFLEKNGDKYFLIKTELEDSYDGFLSNVFQLKDAIKIGGALLGSEDNEIKEKIKDENLDADYTDGLNEFGNQFNGMVDSVLRSKLPKPVHNKLSLCTPLNKDNANDVYKNYVDCDCLHLSSLLLIKGFETGKFSMFIPVDLVEDFFGEQVHEKKTNVLVLDDTFADIKIVRRHLANTEFKVLPANNVNETFTILHKEKIHLILLDLNMPEVSGLEVCNKIKKTPYTKGIPLIMMSSKPTEASVIESLEAGARDFMVKPISKNLLFKKIERFKTKKKQVSLF